MAPHIATEVYSLPRCNKCLFYHSVYMFPISFAKNIPTLGLHETNWLIIQTLAFTSPPKGSSGALCTPPFLHGTLPH